MAVPLYNLSPVLAIMALGALLAIAPVLWVLKRQSGAVPGARLQALTVLTLRPGRLRCASALMVQRHGGCDAAGITAGSAVADVRVPFAPSVRAAGRQGR